MSIKSIEIIYKKYMTISFDEIDNYLNEIANLNNCTKEEVKKTLENYAKGLGLEEYQKYLYRKKQIRYHNYKYVKNVMKFLDKMENGEEIDFSLYERSQPIEDDITRCISYFPEKSSELKILLEKVKKYVYIDSKQCQNTINFIPDFTAMKSSNIESNYLSEIIDIINFKTDEEAITYMRKLQFTERHFKLIIASFTAKFKNSYEYVPKLEERFNKYQEFIKSNTNELKRILDSRKEYNESVNQVVISLIESGYSIEEFCHHYLEYDIKYVENCVKKLVDKKDNDIKLLKEKNSNQEFINEMKNIVAKIENGNYDCIDYYMDTKLSLNDFLNVTKRYGINKVSVSIFINTNIKKNMAINKESELNGNLIIKGREITKEEKSNIFSFLKENEIPINLNTYKMALTKYLNGEIDVETKKYIKK